MDARDSPPRETPRGPKRRHWLRRIGLPVAVGLWLVLLSLWLAFGRPPVWREVLGLKFSAAESSRGTNDKKPATANAELAYRGNGRAELGRYTVHVFNPVTRTSLRTNFRLEGRTTCPDEAAFERLLADRRHLLREQVMVALRCAEPGDLADPGLQMLEKKLVSRINRMLGRRLLVSAEIKDFDLYESVGGAAPRRARPPPTRR